MWYCELYIKSMCSIWSLSWHRTPKTLGLPRDETEKVFCCVRGDLWKHLRPGAGCQWSQPWFRGVGLSVSPCHTHASWEGRGAGDWVQSHNSQRFNQSHLYNEAFVIPKGMGYGERPVWWTCGGAGKAARHTEHTPSPGPFHLPLPSGQPWVMSPCDKLAI